MMHAAHARSCGDQRLLQPEPHTAQSVERRVVA